MYNTSYIVLGITVFIVLGNTVFIVLGISNSYYTPASAICDLQAPSPRAVGPRARCL